MADDLESKIRVILDAITDGRMSDHASTAAELSMLSSQATTRNDLLWIARGYMGIDDHRQVISTCDEALRRDGNRILESAARVFKGYALCMLGSEAMRRGDPGEAKRCYADSVGTLKDAFDFSANSFPDLMLLGIYSFLIANHHLGNHEFVDSTYAYLRKTPVVLAKASPEMIRTMEGYARSSILAIEHRREQEKLFESVLASAKKTYHKPN